MKQIRMIDSKAQFKVCKHLTINAEKAEVNASWEYEPMLKLKCSPCGIIYRFMVLIN